MSIFFSYKSGVILSIYTKTSNFLYYCG